MDVIVIETEAFYTLIEQVVDRLSDKNKKEERWILEDEAMKMLGVKSKTTLGQLRNDGKIRFSKVTGRNLLYDRESILNYIDKKAESTF